MQSFLKTIRQREYNSVEQCTERWIFRQWVYSPQWPLGSGGGEGGECKVYVDLADAILVDTMSCGMYKHNAT